MGVVTCPSSLVTLYIQIMVSICKFLVFMHTGKVHTVSRFRPDFLKGKNGRERDRDMDTMISGDL